MLFISFVKKKKRKESWGTDRCKVISPNFHNKLKLNVWPTNISLLIFQYNFTLLCSLLLWFFFLIFQKSRTLFSFFGNYQKMEVSLSTYNQNFWYISIAGGRGGGFSLESSLRAVIAKKQGTYKSYVWRQRLCLGPWL